MTDHHLRPLLTPASVAVLGASDRPGSLGGRIYSNLREGGFTGPLVAVNPKHDRVAGQRCWQSVAAYGDALDLAVVAVPPNRVLRALKDCAGARTRAAVVMTAGAFDADPHGAALEADIRRFLRKSRMRLLGPNSLGVMRPADGFNATPLPTISTPGELALLTQSGSVGTAALDWAARQGIGFSSVVMTGSGADVSRGEILDFLLGDSLTAGVLLYVEGIREARRFLSGLRAAARAKPIVVMKPGRYATPGTRAAAHTGALVGADAAFDAAVARTGAVRVRTLGALFSAAEALSRGLRVKATSDARDTGLAVIANGTAPAAMAMDRMGDLGLPVPELDEGFRRALRPAKPLHNEDSLPVVLPGDADADAWGAAVDACAGRPGVAAVLAVMAPTAFADAATVAARFADPERPAHPARVACWMGGACMDASHALLKDARIPAFRTPENAVDAVHALATHARNQRLTLELPGAFSLTGPEPLAEARALVAGVVEDGRDALDPLEAQTLLSHFGVPVAEAQFAASLERAREAAALVGYPVVLRPLSPELPFRIVGALRLGVDGPQALSRAWQSMTAAVERARPGARLNAVLVERQQRRLHGRALFAGLRDDPVFGPLIVLGRAGEAHAEAAIALPPLSRFLARRLIDSSPVRSMLDAADGVPAVDTGALEDVLLRLSEIACELPAVRTLTIDPLICDDESAAADAVAVTLHASPEVAPTPRYTHVAIHPYPHQLEQRWTSRDGEALVIRPIRPEDAPEQARFVRALSRKTRLFRFMHELKELPPAMLSRFTQIDYDREMAFVAMRPQLSSAGAERPSEEQVGSARYMRRADNVSCEFAVVVADDWQRRGVAGELMRRLIEHARERGLEQMVGSVLSDNAGMLAFVARFGFAAEQDPEDPAVMTVTLELNGRVKREARRR